MATLEVLSPNKLAAFNMFEMNMPEVPEHRRRILGVMNFQSEEARKETFHNWNSKNVTKEELAKNGFVYCHKDDLVKCFFCQGYLGCWAPGDVVLAEHKKSFPHCKLLLNIAINLPSEGKHCEKIGSYIAQQLDEADPPKRRNSYEADAKKMDTKDKPLRFGEYSDRRKREDTFKKTPECLPPAGKLAEAGFFFSKYADMTQCYKCGGGVINWKPTENPKEVHARLYPNCPLTEKSSQDSVLNFSPNGKYKRKLTPEDLKEELLAFPWVQILRRKYSDEVIKNALADDLEKHLSLPFSVNQAIEVVDDYESSQNY